MSLVNKISCSLTLLAYALFVFSTPVYCPNTEEMFIYVVVYDVLQNAFIRICPLEHFVLKGLRDNKNI